MSDMGGRRKKTVYYDPEMIALLERAAKDKRREFSDFMREVVVYEWLATNGYLGDEHPKPSEHVKKTQTHGRK